MRVTSISATPPSGCNGDGCVLGLGIDAKGLDLVLPVVALAMLFPVLVFIATATRLSAARREQRFAAMRLTGAAPKQISVIAAVALESAIPLLAVAAVAIGVGFGVSAMYATMQLAHPLVAPDAAYYLLTVAGIMVALGIITATFPLLSAVCGIWNWHTVIHTFPASIRAAAAGQAQNVAEAHISAVTQALGPDYRHAAVQSFVHGYHLAVGISAAFLVVAAAAALLGFRKPAEASGPVTPAAFAADRDQHPGNTAHTDVQMKAMQGGEPLD